MKHALIIITGRRNDEDVDVSVADVRGYGKPLARTIELFKPHVDAVVVTTSRQSAMTAQRTATHVCRTWLGPLFSHTAPNERTNTAGDAYRALTKVRIAKKVTIVSGETVFRTPIPVDALRQDTMLVDREARSQGALRVMLEQDVVFGITSGDGEAEYLPVTTLSEKSWRRYVRIYRSLTPAQKLLWSFEAVMERFIATADEQSGLIRAFAVEPGTVQDISLLSEQTAFEALIEAEGGWTCA